MLEVVEAVDDVGHRWGLTTYRSEILLGLVSTIGESCSMASRVGRNCFFFLEPDRDDRRVFRRMTLEGSWEGEENQKILAAEEIVEVMEDRQRPQPSGTGSIH